MHENLLIRNSTVKERTSRFNQAYQISQLEYGQLNNEEFSQINSYIYGIKELSAVMQGFKDKNDELGLVTGNIMILDAELKKIYFDYQFYVELHKKIFLSLPYAGKIRTADLTQEQFCPSGQDIPFLPPGEIADMVKKNMEQMQKVSHNLQIDKILDNILKKLKEVNNWDYELDKKCDLLAAITGSLYHTNAFLIGNVTLIIYLVTKFTELNQFPVERAVICREYLKGNVLKSILLSSVREEPDISFLSKIYQYAIDQKAKEVQQKPSPEERIPISVKIEKARLEREYFNEIFEEMDEE